MGNFNQQFSHKALIINHNLKMITFLTKGGNLLPAVVDNLISGAGF
jgi:hypothetical protein